MTAITQAPTLETDRLILRPMHYEDWPEYQRFMATDRSAFMGGPFSRAHAWGIFCNDVAQWTLFGHCCLMMVAKDSGAVLGQVGINHGPLFPEKELGWMVYPEAEGKGLAYEAAMALRQWASEEAGLEGLVSYIDPQNVRSQRLAERMGASLDPNAPRQDPEDLVYRHPQL